MAKGDKMKVEVAGDIFAGCIAAAVFIFSAIMMRTPKSENPKDDT